MQFTKKFIKVKKYSLPYSIEFRNVKLARIELLPTKEVKLIFPVGYETIEVPKLLNEFKEWIETKISQIDATLTKLGLSWDKMGEKEIIFGQLYELRIIQQSYYAVFFEGSMISITGKNQTTAIDFLRETILDELKKKVERFSNYFSKRMGVEVKKINIKHQKKIWGSCSKKGTININFKAAILSDELLMFLVAHELAHLRYPNHGKEFKLLLSSFFENIKEKNDLLEAFWFLSHSSKIFASN